MARADLDVHRHRIRSRSRAAHHGVAIERATNVIARRVLSAQQGHDGVHASILARGAGAPEQHCFARAIDCTGLPDNPRRSSNPLIRALFARGLARADPLGIGLDVAETYALIDANGHPSSRIQVIGPLARAAFWECIAIPDIRLQCEDIAQAFAAELAESP